MYHVCMTKALASTARFSLLLLAGFILGFAALAIALASNGKNNLLQKLGVSSGALAAADSACEVPSEEADNEVYFVSCGGFF